MAPLVILEDPAVQNCLAGLDALADSCEAEPVQAAEGIESRGREGNVRHVEVFQMASVKASIIGNLDVYPRTDARTPRSATIPSSAKSRQSESREKN